MAKPANPNIVTGYASLPATSSPRYMGTRTDWAALVNPKSNGPKLKIFSPPSNGSVLVAKLLSAKAKFGLSYYLTCYYYYI